MILQTENINLHIRHYLECDIANRENKLAHTTLFGMWYCKQKTETCIYDIIWNVILQTEKINLHIRHYFECDIANRKQKPADIWNVILQTENRNLHIFGMTYCKQKTWICTYDIIWNVILQTENINLHIRHYLECDIANREHKLAHTTLFGMWYCKQKT